ncbi:MAG TPA: HD domain-containing protein [Mucilaginibacter sp.]|jgi:hypothetical protein|nr:HD domain-containing protein [Mucilaginibacter sp.]
MLFHEAKAFILDKLNDELPTHLTYHCFDHTLDVYAAAENLADLEKIGLYQKELVLTAALFHDSGFIIGANCHEEESCRIAEQYLPRYGYVIDDLEAVKGMIMATKLPQAPKDHLEEIMADADLDYLGRDDFFPISEGLYKEFMLSGIVANYDDWNRLQVAFFENHHYFTQSAQAIRNLKKAENLALIKAKIRRY